MPDVQPGAVPSDTATEVFADHRELLFSVVYNLLGGVADTEDVLQDAWLAWAARHRDAAAEPIGNPRAYLVRIAVNAALARQAAISRRRESYVGPWLPEPLVEPAAGAEDAADPVLRAESVSMALLVVLETLSPLERAVFVLHEVFGYPLTEVAGILDRSAPAVRQLAHRARAHVRARRPRHHADPRLQREVTERFLAAAFGGGIADLLELLAPDVTLWSDGGGKRGAALRPVRGSGRVARLISEVTASGRAASAALDVRYRTVNGDPSAVLFDHDAPFAVMVLDLDADGRIEGVYTVLNPDKLARIDGRD
ncbi:RNA polymerase sigma factor SigJ [Actinomadura parmotrematis]|uniref:RNA polymerase sigma factor SigJ n=1 Tax=Actinomadura parmotrematis TaxID=2864039 RepID=A0ABS7G5G0_9ACTN|nr:RNA polymerase sigma factor SigJ [Actinomadura parmotrematis]MBW8486863.1 RNA polymerase sigma factor SigJ [Actinomadura parmotrematis]